MGFTIAKKIGLAFSVVVLEFVVLFSLAYLELETVQASKRGLFLTNLASAVIESLNAEVKQNTTRTYAVTFSDGSTLANLFVSAMKESRGLTQDLLGKYGKVVI